GPKARILKKIEYNFKRLSKNQRCVPFYFREESAMVDREEKDSRFSLSLFVSAVFVLALAAFLFTLLFPFRDDSLARVQEKGIRVGYAVEAPYAFLTTAGEPTGEAPEMVRVVAEQLEIAPILWRQVEFDSLIDELEA